MKYLELLGEPPDFEPAEFKYLKNFYKIINVQEFDENYPILTINENHAHHTTGYRIGLIKIYAVNIVDTLELYDGEKVPYPIGHVFIWENLYFHRELVNFSKLRTHIKKTGWIYVTTTPKSQK